jgi:putative transposase
MTRPLRILYANAWYHVMNRGASRITIFHDHHDYKTFLNILSQVCSRYRFEIHAYCLMPNHYHLMICTPLSNLSQGMRHLDGLYTKYHNKKYGKDGSLFRGRYKAILIDAENYLLRLSKYIHLNPTRAKLVQHPAKYPWSSYKFYSRNIKFPNWLHKNEILSRFGTKQQKSKYRLFVMEGRDNELEIFYHKLKLLPVLGTDAFRKQINEIYLKENSYLREMPEYKRIPPCPTIIQICTRVANYYNVPIETLYIVDRKKGNQPRTIAIYLAAELSGNKFTAIANFFKHISNSGISQIIRRINKIKLHRPSLVAELKNIVSKF